MEIKKIEDTSMNLEVKGQGCWNDCYVGGYWSGKKAHRLMVAPIMMYPIAHRQISGVNTSLNKV